MAEGPYWNREDRISTVKVLLERGALLDETKGPRKKLSALEIAFYSEEVELLKTLLRNGARITKATIRAARELVFNDCLEALLQGATDDNVDRDTKDDVLRLQEYVSERGIGNLEATIKPSGSLSDEAQRGGASDLRAAASNGNLDQVKQSLHSLQRGSDNNGHLPAAQMALHLAARYHHLSVVEFLLQSEVSLKHQDASGNTPLHNACIMASTINSNGYKIIQILVERGADPTTLNKNEVSPLHIAAQQKNDDSVGVLKLLFEESAGLTAIMKHGKSKPCPVWCAIEQGNDASTAFLPENCTSEFLKGLKWKKSTCLAPAIYRDSSAIIEILLQKGCDVNQSTGNERWPIHLASGPKGSLAALKMLLRHGADISSIRGDGFSALHIIAEQPQENSLDKLDALIAAGADINSTTPKGQSVIHIAVSHDQTFSRRDLLQLISAMIEKHGADLNHKDGEGKTALMISLEVSFDEAFDLLIAHGCDTAAVDSIHRTALHYACEKRPSITNNEQIQKILDAGLQLAGKDSKGKTAFELALDCEDLAR